MQGSAVADNGVMPQQPLRTTPAKNRARRPRLDLQEPGVAKYLRLRNALARQISAGSWTPGSQLPPEEEIVEMSGLSLGTVQRALRMLVDDGLLVRKQGVGTFVASEAVPMKAPFYHCRFVDDEGQLLTIYSKVLRRSPAAGRGPWTAVMHGPAISCLDRVFSIANEFPIFVRLYFDAVQLPSLGSLPLEDLNGVNLKTLLSGEGAVPLARFVENLSVRFFPQDVVQALNVPRRTSGAVLEITAYDRDGHALYFQELYIPPNGRRLLVAP